MKNGLVFETFENVVEVFNNIKEFVECYGCITKADLCDICDLPSRYADNKVGWTTLRNVQIICGENEFELKFPEPMLLETAFDTVKDGYVQNAYAALLNDDVNEAIGYLGQYLND